MRFRKIEHIGIAVSDLKTSNKIYEKLLGVAPYKQETVDTDKVNTSFFRVGNNKIELVEAIDESSPVAKFISKRGEGVHHIAFDVSDIRKEMERLRNEGFQVLSEEPIKGADNKLVCFVHPKDTSGVLIELCENIS